MKTVRWGILGCGNVCEHKAGPALQGVRGSRLVAVMRRTADKARDFARRHRVPRWYGSVDELLADADVDSVYVATPDDCHYEMTMAALRAGKDVLVEKAMARNAAECDEMVDEARQLGRRLAVAYYRRGYPTVLRARELLMDGAIGRVSEIHINDEFPLSHRLDLLHYLLGDMQAVRIESEALPPCSAETVGRMIHCRHIDGAVGITPLAWDENLVPETLDIRGESGRILVLDLKAGKLVLGRDGSEKISEDLGPLPATHWGLVENYVQHVNGFAPLLCDGVEGRKSTVIMDLVVQLDRDGIDVAVDYG